jgi:hypothetical protein
MTIWYILCLFGTFNPVLVSCTKKNLATLVPHTKISRPGNYGSEKLKRPIFHPLLFLAQRSRNLFNADGVK